MPVKTNIIRSTYTHSDEFQSILQTPRQYLHLMISTETWFSPDNSDSLKTCSSFHSFVKNQKSGVLLVVIKITVIYRLINEFSFVDNGFELCAVEVKLIF